MCIAFAIAVVVVIKENGEELDGSQEGRLPIALTQIDKQKEGTATEVTVCKSSCHYLFCVNLMYSDGFSIERFGVDIFISSRDRIAISSSLVAQNSVGM